MSKSIQFKDKDGKNVYPYALLEEFILFSGSENIELTLNDTVLNYKYIEVFALVGNVWTSVKIPGPRNKFFSLVIKSFETSLLQFDAATYFISDNKITLRQAQRINLGTIYGGPWDTSNIYIQRVVGYK